MLLADDQNMIQALTPKRSDQAFSGDLGDMGRSRIPIARIALVALYSVLVACSCLSGCQCASRRGRDANCSDILHEYPSLL